jgi:hypothetical protein
MTKLTPWQKGMLEFHRQTWKGGGAIETAIIRREHALAGMVEERKLRTIAEWFKAVRGGHPLCLACEHEFIAGEDVTAFSFAIPFIDDDETTQAIVTGICESCAGKDDAELLEIAYQGFKEMGMVNRKIERGTA